jgi:hypothetical protein
MERDRQGSSLLPEQYQMIILDEERFINRGTRRACYQHSENPNLVIKVPVGDKKDKELANLKELKGYHALVRKHIDLSCISHCYGFITTSHGTGLVCDCIRDHDGNISRTIADIITSGEDYDPAYILAVAQKFCDILKSKKVYIFDLNIKNIALKLQLDGSYLPFAIDLKGRYDNNEFFPFSSYIDFLSRKKMARRSRQLIERISLFGTIKI